MVGFGGNKDVGRVGGTIADSAAAKKSLRFEPKNLPGGPR